jgi:hypothetical protein
MPRGLLLCDHDKVTTTARAAAILAAAAALWAAAWSPGCRTAPEAAVDPGMASCVPPGAALVAGFDLDRLRASPLYPKLPGTVLAAAESFRGASRLLLVYNGRDLLSIARGRFPAPPAGATLVQRDLALAGTPEEIRLATAQHSSGRTGTPDLLDRAASIATGSAVWVVVRGSAAVLPGGEFANLSRLLAMTEYATAAARLDSGVELNAAGLCSTGDKAQRLEESLRGLLSLAVAGMSRQPETAALLRSIQVSREDRTVHASLSASGSAAESLLAQLAR